VVAGGVATDELVGTGLLLHGDHLDVAQDCRLAPRAQRAIERFA
jgi:hypothetical protein